MYTSAPQFSVFLVAEVIFACAFTLLSGADEALLYDSLAALDRLVESKSTLARLESFKLAGIVVGALLGGPIASRFGLRMPMLLEAVPMTGAALIAMTLQEPPIVTAHGPTRTFGQVLTEGVRYFMRHRILRVMAQDMVGVGAIAWIIIWLYQPLLETAGVGIAYFGIMHALMTLGQIAVLSNISWLETQLGSKRRLLFASALITAAAFLVLGQVTRAPIVVAAILTAASFGLARGPLFSNYMNKHIPSDKRATVLSAISMLRTLAVAIVNPIVGALADWSLHGTMLILGSVALGLAFASRIEEDQLID